MIVSLEEGLIQWMKLELPDVIVGDKEGVDQSLKVLDEVEQEYQLSIYVGESEEHDHMTHIHYCKNFKTLIMGTETGVLGRLEVQAEAINYDEEEEEGQQAKEKKILTQSFQELGRFHTMKINGISELGDTS